MKKDFIEKQKTILLEQRKELIESLTSQSEQLRGLAATTTEGDEVDIASNEIDRKLLNQLGEQDSLRLSQIDRALERINKGTYGVCLKCGGQITEGRLEAIPYAATCISCQEAMERQRGR